FDDQFEDISLETGLSARQPNGELPLKFARPKVGSIFEDKGTPIENFYCADVFKDYYYKNTEKWLDDYSFTVTLPYSGQAPDYGAYEAGWERPAFELQTLPVNDGTLPDVDEITSMGGKDYQKKLLINDYLFQDATLAKSISQYVSDAATGNKILPTYYGKSGTYPPKIGALYGGATQGAYVIAKSSGYVEFSVPSLSEMRSNCYGGGKTSTLQMQWKRPGESSWHDGESVTFDQRVFTVNFVEYGIPQTNEPIIVRINSTGSNDVYLTDLTLNGFEEYKGDIPTAVKEVKASEPNICFTSNGIIFYGDIASIMVYNANGSLVAQSAMSQFCNLSTLPAGMYVAKATTKDGQTLSTKLMRR
ncbi:MAG: T9SS type A sorting domain-containing protein, partial [Prevotella sp.]|nr:T9SS type A sorting domain-containing protein [Prevotella sp.]